MKQRKTFIISEMACSHEGKPELAKKIVAASYAAGADAVQLQIWAVDAMMSPKRKEYDLLNSIELSQEQWSDIIMYTRKHCPGMEIYVCVYEHASIEFIDGLDVDGYKLNSSDLSNPLVLDKIADTGKPINLSVGASSLGEIQSAISRLQRRTKAKITLMYGHQSFPTMPDNVHMGFMSKLSDLFELPIGYQDHSDADSDSAFWLPASSVGMGVNVLEKHITHDRSMKGIDHESALNPDEFARFVEMVRVIDAAKGISTPREYSEDEIKYREFQKKSIVAMRDICEGEVIAPEDVGFMRANTLGISPANLSEVIGKRAVRDIRAYEAFENGDYT